MGSESTPRTISGARSFEPAPHTHWITFERSVLVVAAKGGAAQRLAKAGEAAAFALGAAPVEFAVSVEGKS